MKYYVILTTGDRLEISQVDHGTLVRYIERHADLGVKLTNSDILKTTAVIYLGKENEGEEIPEPTPLEDIEIEVPSKKASPALEAIEKAKAAEKEKLSKKVK